MVNESLNELALRSLNGERIIKHEFNRIIADQFLLDKLSDMNPTQFSWHIVNQTWEKPLCRTCNGPVKFNSNKRKYADNCSKKCCFSDPQRQQRIQSTMLSKYGFTNSANCPEIQERKNKTIRSKYGVDHISKNQVIKDKKKQTMIDRWGVENPSQNQEIQQRKIDTNQARRGVDWAPQDPNVQSKMRETTFKNYGVYCGLSHPEIRERGKATMLAKYGVESPQQSSEIVAKTMQTNLKRYGSPHIFSSSIIREQIRKTSQDRYSSDSWRSSEIGKSALKALCIAQTGYSNYAKDPKIKKISRETFLKNYKLSHPNFVDTPDILISPEKFIETVTALTPLEASIKLGVHTSTIYRLSNLYECRSVMTQTTNTYEKKITDLLDMLGINYVSRTWNIIPPHEIDIWIPSHNVAIEVGSVYWHGERTGRTQWYHYDKWKKCLDKNIKLFQWFDEDLYDNWHLTESRLRRMLGFPVPVIGARKLEIIKIDTESERQFLNKWHAKGYSNNRNIAIGATYNTQLVAVMTIHNTIGGAIIDRWATDIYKSWPGAFSRVLKHWIKESGFTGKISTWSDNRLGDGKVYSSCGFDKIRVSKPGSWYFKDNGLEHRLKYQKHKLGDMFGLNQEQLKESAWSIMQSQGYDRLWDAGHTLWTKTI